MVASVAQVSQAIREAGFNDYNQLIAAIKELEIKIAEAKDSGREYTEMEKLLQKYIAIKEQADQEEEQRKAKQKTIIGVMIAVSVIVLGVMFAIVFSMI